MTLDQFIDSRRQATFAYFDNDCAGFAADWIAERTGTDPLADLRAPGGPLAERRFLAVMRLVRAEGGFKAAATARLGEPVAGLMARMGDVCFLLNGQPVRGLRGYSFGVCTGSHIAVPGPLGLEFHPLTLAQAAWQL